MSQLGAACLVLVTYADCVGILYLVATPIGNLEDMTLRAIRVLGEVSAVAAEDTRTARHLLQHFGISARLLSYTEHNHRARTPQILALLQTGDVALVSEAGMPAISDPGQELVVAAVAAGHTISPIPGASAVPAAVAVSGLPSRQFVYLGFLPRRPGERRALLGSLAAEPRTLVCFEAPSRLLATLRDVRDCLGDRRVALCRELTKLHEQILRGSVSELLASADTPRGEYCVVIQGATAEPRSGLDEHALARLRALKERGAGAREASAALAAELGLPRRRIYEAWLGLP
jgi:16S rRNA (cytidine1402-2'-O)-methyltransferase